MTVSVQPVVLTSRKVRAALDALLAPDAGGWDKADAAVVPLEPTQLDRQPSAYVRASWRDRPRNDVTEVSVRMLTNASALAIRLDWAAPRPHRRISDVNVYPDGCALLFPADGVNLEHETMGSPEHPVEAWYWRAGDDVPFVLNATGLGTSERLDSHDVVVDSRWADGRWQVAFARPIKASGVPLDRKARVPVAFAIWSGAATERAGLKSYSRQPIEIAVGA